MKNKNYKILFCGDLHLSNSKYLLSEDIIKFFNNHDEVVVNLESPILPIGNNILKSLKAGPNIQQSEINVQELLKKLGVRYLGGANNHIYDYGIEGIRNSILFSKKNKMIFFGAGMDLENALKPAIIQNNIVILAVGEDEFGMSDTQTGGYSRLYDNSLDKRIISYRKSGKIVIVFAHGGGEEIPFPSEFIRNRYRSLIDSGALLIVGHHPHIPQGFEKYNRGLIYYSLGNLIHTSFRKSYGNVLSVEIKNKKITKTKLYSVNVGSKNIVTLENLSKPERIYFDEINKIMLDYNKYEKILNIQAVDMFNKYYKNYFSNLNLNSMSELLLLQVLLKNNSHKEFIIRALNTLISKSKNEIALTVKYRLLEKFIKIKLNL